VGRCPGSRQGKRIMELQHEREHDIHIKILCKQRSRDNHAKNEKSVSLLNHRRKWAR
jgi:hypothetical protein